MSYLNLVKKICLLCCSLILVSTAFADGWQLNNDASQLNFISIKKTHVAETHQFKKLEGLLDEQGQFSLTIDLASVDTNIAVRDERMKLHLFDVAQFATAKLNAQVDLEELDSIAEGASKKMQLAATIELHGQTQVLNVTVMVSRLVGAKLSVVSIQPVILNVGDFALVAGVEKLKELAKLPSISHAVPVSFYLTFNHI